MRERFFDSGFVRFELRYCSKRHRCIGLCCSCARADIRQIIDIGSCDKLPYQDNSFDCCIAVNVIHNLDLARCKKSITEMQRVVKDQRKIFIQVDAYTNTQEREMFEQWLLTAKTYLNCDDWITLFKEVGYEGDYFWTIIGFDK